MDNRPRFESPLLDTRTDPAHHQLPIQAVKIFLDLALGTMYNNDGIKKEDWDWFYRATVNLSSIAWKKTLDEKV